MSGRFYLTQKQQLVLDDIFGGELSEDEVLARHNLSRRVYNRWLGEEHFQAEFDARVEWAYRQSEALIARYAPLAAAKLVQLTESSSQETARKACIDIISLPRQTMSSRKEKSRPETAERRQKLSPAVASKLLAALAKVKRPKASQK